MISGGICALTVFMYSRDYFDWNGMTLEVVFYLALSESVYHSGFSSFNSLGWSFAT